MLKHHKKIANLIAKLRKDTGYNQMEFAKICGVSFRTLQRIESGDISPRLEMLFRVLTRLNVQPTQFFLELFFNAHEQFDLTHNISINTKIDDTSQQMCEVPLLIQLFEIEAIKKSLNNDFENGVSHIGYWEWDLKNSKFYWSEQMFEIYDVEMKREFEVSWVSKIVQEDREKVQKDIDNLIYRDVTYHNIHRVASNGQIFRVRGFAKKFVNSHGEPFIFGIAERIES